MSDRVESKGKCLCGKVTVTAGAVSKSLGACHCSMCRSWSGGPFMTVDCGCDVIFTGQENIKVFDSSDWAERGFCSHCGSHLFYRLKANNQYMMPVGIFENIEGATFDHQVFIDEKPDYYSFANETHNMTGEELFEQFAQK